MSRNNAISIFKAGCAAVQPAVLLPSFIERQDDKFRIGEQIYKRSEIDHIYLIAIGKAAPAMALVLQQFIGDWIAEAIVISKDGHFQPGLKWPVMEAGHPIPDNRSVKAGKLALKLAEKAGKNDLLILLISGGSSSLVTDLTGGIDLPALQKLSGLLLNSGASIAEINSVRKHLSSLKGGQLARVSFPATVHSLILSDVPDDDMSVIASGPTYPDTSTFREALSVIEKYKLKELVSPAIIARLKDGINRHIPETPKPGDAVFERVKNQLTGTNQMAISAAANEARILGYDVILINEPLKGESRVVAEKLISMVLNTPVNKPTCFIAGGETTVTIQGKGKGGRNQEFVLAALVALLKNNPVSFPVVLSGGTDGSDGPTDAAGAVADETLLKLMDAAGINPLSYLQNNDSYHFFKQVNGLLITGPTNTNVMDLVIIILPNP